MCDKHFGRFGHQTIKIFMILGLMAGAFAPTSAQNDDMLANSAAQLGLPAEFTVFGQRDPNIRTPTAIVNGEIVTRTDVDHRFNLFLAANNAAQISDQERQRLRMQIVRNLIDETLQIQEARANDILIPAVDIDTTFTQVAQRSNATPDQFAEFLPANSRKPQRRPLVAI